MSTVSTNSLSWQASTKAASQQPIAESAVAKQQQQQQQQQPASKHHNIVRQQWTDCNTWPVNTQRATELIMMSIGMRATAANHLKTIVMKMRRTSSRVNNHSDVLCLPSQRLNMCLHQELLKYSTAMTMTQAIGKIATLKSGLSLSSRTRRLIFTYRSAKIWRRQTTKVSYSFVYWSILQISHLFECSHLLEVC